MPFFRQDEGLAEIAQQILQTTSEKFPTLTRDKIALTWIVYEEPVIVNTGGALSAAEFWQYQVKGFSYRGVERIYPASIVKLFYLVAIQEWLQGGMIAESLELNRAIRDAIIASSNDATSLLVDVLTGTTSGPELPANPFATWQKQRNIINRYFASLDWSELESINVNQKTWCDGAYGRERAFLGELMENRNMLTTDAVARLLHSIIGGVAVSSERSQKMMQLLKRSLNPAEFVDSDGENQITGFIGEALPRDAKIWSKAGWTTQVRHDAAYIEVPGVSPYLLIIFTEGGDNAQNKSIIPFISRHILAGQ
ncbi:serine hydrolase [Pleurocapsa sp. CCALA 161]|uniref:serine hydrolase n=1 Tax=Pleurocapsa sp. CCALA 161 TaxID=2107688 RepID=UPI000D05317B|nr:serine hydrolase [Pleurocapsa sp. CCALA 161]PSB08506.1 serine hydrolase [Pleurocapsa sp. CCALA 161]